MPNVTSGLGTSNDQIPLLNKTEIWKASGLHMHFETLAELNAGVTKEVANIVATSAIWFNGQPISVASEPVGVHRVWSTSLQHACTVVIRPGLTLVLAANSNTVLAAAGVPSGGTGANGDISIDWAGNRVYRKNAGAWTSVVDPIFAGGVAGTTFSATVINQTDTLANLLALAGNQGQIAVPTDSTGVVRFTGVAGQAQHLASGGAVKVVDASAFPTGETQVTVSNDQTKVHVVYGGNANNPLIRLNFPTAPAYGQELQVSSDFRSNAIVCYVNGSPILPSGESDVQLGYTNTFKWFKQESATAAAWFLVDAKFTNDVSATVYNKNKVVLGGATQADGADIIALGRAARIMGTGSNGSTAIGVNSKVTGSGSIALGGGEVIADNAIAIGSATLAEGHRTTAIGYGSNALGEASVAVGGGYTSNFGAVAIGDQVRSITAYSASLPAGAQGGFFSTVGLAAFGLNSTATRELTADTSSVVAGVRDQNLWYVPDFNYIGNPTLYEADVTILGTSTSGATRAYRANKRFCFKIDENDDVSIVGAIIDTTSPLLVNATAPTVTITEDNTNKAIRISITLGSAAEGAWNFRAIAKVVG